MPLKLGTNNHPHRKELDEITESYADDAHVGQQISLIRDLAGRYPHSMTLVQAMIPHGPTDSPFDTCYTRSFSLSNADPMIQILQQNWCVRLNHKFMQFLIETRLREVSFQDAKDGDHVVYAGSHIKHAGSVSQSAVESKWGRAHFWKHGLFEVPLRYGDEVRCFRHISQEDALQGFLEYARKEGAISV